MRIGICAGHSLVSPGAVSGRLRERDVCRDVVDLATPLLHDCGHLVFDPRSDETEYGFPIYLAQRIQFYNRQQLDLAIDVHLNSWSDPSVNYAMTVIGEGRKDSEDVAASIADAFTSMPWPSRGAVPDMGLGRRLMFCRRVKCPAVIVEPLFISSPEARGWLGDEKGRERLALMLVEGIEAWVNPSAAARGRLVRELGNSTQRPASSEAARLAESGDSAGDVEASNGTA